VIPTLEQLRIWLAARENEYLEFKEARGGFHFEKLAKYCAALANQGGGSIVLGVTDRRPRRVVGSAAFENLERTKAGPIERLRLKVEATELTHPDGRVLVFTVPARPLGVPISVDGAYWMRAGEDLVPMTPDMLRTIFDETRPDFSAEMAHRDYRHGGSIFVRQYSRRIEVASPGGLPRITVQNILYTQNPRNRRLADSFARCGLVERAGQGTDRIYEECIKQGKALPDFTHTDAYQVSLTLHGDFVDDGFLQFLHRLHEENIETTTTQDLLVFDRVRRGERVPRELRPWLRRLLKLKVLEPVGRGVGTRYVFAERFLSSASLVLGARPVGRDVRKEALLQHLREKGDNGAKFEDFRQLMPDVARVHIQRLMRELREEGLVESRGETKGSRWFAVVNEAIPG
jgi:predicted HTH transcriptional regulator